MVFLKPTVEIFFNMHTIPTDLSLKNWKNVFFLAVLLLLSPNFAWGLSLTLETICICYSWSNRWYSPQYFSKKKLWFWVKLSKIFGKVKNGQLSVQLFPCCKKNKKTKKFISNFFVYSTFQVEKSSFLAIF